MLQRLRTDTLVISGAETDVCVLATVMVAVDAGYRVILAKDALCSVSDESHDAMLRPLTRPARNTTSDRDRQGADHG